jgi:hypothetical protein
MRAALLASALFAAGLLLPLAAAAQPVPGKAAGAAIPGASAESRDAALALGPAIGVAGQAADLLARIRMDLLRRTMQQSGKRVDEAAPIVDELLMPGFTEQAGGLNAALLEPWASNFSPGELRMLRSFFASPLGQRYLRLQPVLASQAVRESEEWSQRVFRQTIDRRMDELRARGVQF